MFSVLTLAVGAYQSSPLKGLLVITGTLTFLVMLVFGVIVAGVKIGRAKAILLATAAFSLMTVAAINNGYAVAIPSTQNYQTGCLLNSTTSGSASSSTTTVDATSASCNSPDSGNPNYEGIVGSGATASDSILGTDNAKGDVVLSDSSFYQNNSGTVQFTGDYYLYGYIHVEGSAAIAGAFYPDAYVTVTLQLSGPSSFSWVLFDKELTQSDCGGAAVLSAINCFRTTTVSGDQSYSESAYISPGTYTLSLKVETYAYVNVGALAGSSALSCFSPFEQNCVHNNCSCTDVPPAALPPTTVSTHLCTLVGGGGCQGYYAQWKYNSYSDPPPPSGGTGGGTGGGGLCGSKTAGYCPE